MKLEKMSQIAANRTKGEWKYTYFLDSPNRERDIGTDEVDGIISRDSGVYGPCDEDADFIIMAANQWDKIMAVVDAANECVIDNQTNFKGLECWFKETPYDRLVQSLKNLESE